MTKKKLILDAKYKSQIDYVADVNQVITYLYRMKGRIGMFVHPTTDKKD